MFNWQQYFDHLKLMLHNLLYDENSKDVTLVSDDKAKLRAHKIVLKACSPVFETLLVGSDGNNSVVYLRGVQQCELESILQFMYLGETSVYQERVDEFINVAKSLEIKELCENIYTKDETVDSEYETMEEGQIGDINLEDDKFELMNKIESDLKENKKTQVARKSNKRASHKSMKYHCHRCDHKSASMIGLSIHVEQFHSNV